MTALKDKIKTALDENRMLVLVVQVLFGFQYRGAFEAGFERLPAFAQNIKLVAFLLLAITVALLLTPAAYHRIAAAGESTEVCHETITSFVQLALCPFAIGLGLDFFGPGFQLFGMAGGVAAGAVTAGAALFFWYAIAIMRRAKHPGEPEALPMENTNEKPEKTPLKDKINQVLTEGRVVLPGTQALLGFQLAAFLTEAFEKLPRSLQLLHFAALGCVGVSAILLMTPPAYHRLVERGEQTEHFLRLASRFVVAAMVPLGLGMTLDFFVVAEKITDSPPLAIALSAGVLALFFGLWFAFPLWSARRRGVQPFTSPA